MFKNIADVDHLNMFDGRNGRNVTIHSDLKSVDIQIMKTLCQRSWKSQSSDTT